MGFEQLALRGTGRPLHRSFSARVSRFVPGMQFGQAGAASTAQRISEAFKRGRRTTLVSSLRGDTAVSETIFTVGHSTRSSDEFLDVLEAYGVEIVADIRRMPGSRRLPQFDASTLGDSLAGLGIDYCWIAQLGGRRRPDPQSPNTGWRHAAFRAYADHMLTDEFADGLFELLMLASGRRTAVMCAEVLWWRCHRRLVADVLVVLGLEVVHIFNTEKHEAHRLAAPARLVGGNLSYESP